MKADAKLLPLKSAARVLGVKPSSLQSEADAGRVPFIKIGDDYLFSPVELERALLARLPREGGEGAAHGG